jgi:ketosteroid isomerase-like protein
MKKMMMMVAVTLFAIAPLALAQTADAKKPQGAAPPQSNVESTLTQMEHDLTAAILKRNVAAIDPVLASDFAFTGPDGNVQGKAQFINDIKSGDLALEASAISDMKVRVYGDAAVATYTTTDKGQYKGQDIGGRYRWTDVFVRRAGKWQIVAGHGTPIAPPKK